MVDANPDGEVDAAATGVEASDAQRGSDYPFSIQVSLDISLAQFKVQVAAALDIADPGSFLCKRSSANGAPQLKDETKSLRDLAFVNHSVVHLQVL